MANDRRKLERRREKRSAGSDKAERTNRLLRESLDSYARQHSDLQGTWDNLEKKAQASIAVAGVFLGGLLTFARNVNDNTPTADRVFAAIVVGFVVTAILSAGLAMRVQNISQPPLGSNVEPMVNRLMGVDDIDEQDAREQNFLRDWRQMWAKGNNEIEKLIHEKARWVGFAQLFLFLGTLVGAAWTLAAMFVSV